MGIEFKNVDFSYKKINYIEKEVLKDINIKIEQGKITSIIGESGSGKTTILELISSIIVPTNGEIIFNNVNKIGFLFQFPEDQFFNQMVKKELEVILKLNNYKTKDKEKRISDALKMVGLSDEYLNMNPFNLSNGEKRKLALASVLILNPDVLLLDEPTIGLDDKSKNELINLIRLLKKRYNKTVVIASHDMDFIHKITDYIYVLDNKTIILEGDKYSVFKKEEELNKINLKVPKLIEFSNRVLKLKKIKIGYRDDINDLIKDIYRYAK